MNPVSPRTAVRVAAVALALACLSSVRGDAAVDGVYVYGMNLFGKLSVNGTIIDDQPGGFEVDDDDVDGIEDAWTGLAVEGADRYSLQFDGLVRKNGKKLFKLPYIGYRWVGIAVEDETVFCLTSDGVIAVNDDVVGDLAMEGFGYLALAVHNGRIYSLRADGQVFRDADRSDFVKFTAGNGEASFLPDGWGLDTIWWRIAVDPTDEGRLIALRADGNLYWAPLSGVSPEGFQIAELPFVYGFDEDDDDDLDDYPLADDVFTDLELSPTGTWVVLCADGRVFTEQRGAIVPDADLPDQFDQLPTLYTDIAVRGSDYWVMRADGKVYCNGQTPPVLELPGTTYGRVAVSDQPPDTSEIEEHPPKATILHTRTVVGTPLTVHAIVSDTETATADIVVTPFKLPVDETGSAATWDANAKAMLWDAPQVAGEYKFKFDVTDSAGATARFVYVIEVFGADDDPEENKTPKTPSITSARAIVGQPFVLPLILDDKDHDPLTVAVDLGDYPYTAGATFDKGTNTFAWTPSAEDQGDVTLKFKVHDGTVEKKFEVVLKVKNGLIF